MSAARESVEAFALRARSWLPANMPPADSGSGQFFLTATRQSDEEDLARVQLCRVLQRRLFRRGFRRHLRAQGVWGSGSDSGVSSGVQPRDTRL